MTNTSGHMTRVMKIRQTVRQSTHYLHTHDYNYIKNTFMYMYMYTRVVLVWPLLVIVIVWWFSQSYSWLTKIILGLLKGFSFS